MIRKIFNLNNTTNMSELFLNLTDLKLLAKDKLVTIGSHSQDHLCLKNLIKILFVSR